MKDEKGEAKTVGLVVLIAAIILAGLYFYDKGTAKAINVTMNLGKNVVLTLNQARTKPSEYGKSYVIFNAVSSNQTNKTVDFHVSYPKSPCSTASSIGGEYDKCVSSQAYLTYLDEYDDVVYQNDSSQSGIKLQAPNKEYCTIEDYYSPNRSVKNIGYSLTDYYQANESKTGVLVFQCPAQKGAFTLIYKDQSEEINI